MTFDEWWADYSGSITIYRKDKDARELAQTAWNAAISSIPRLVEMPGMQLLEGLLGEKPPNSK